MSELEYDDDEIKPLPGDKLDLSPGEINHVKRDALPTSYDVPVRGVYLVLRPAHRAQPELGLEAEPAIVELSIITEYAAYPHPLMRIELPDGNYEHIAKYASAMKIKKAIGLVPADANAAEFARIPGVSNYYCECVDCKKTVLTTIDRDKQTINCSECKKVLHRVQHI